MRNLISCLALGAALITSTTASAQRLVYDPWNVAEGIAQNSALAKQLTELYQSNKHLFDQLLEAQEQTKALTGTRDMGDFANSLLDKTLRRQIPGNWSSLVDAVSSGDTSRISTAAAMMVEELHQKYPAMEGADFSALDPNYAGVVNTVNETNHANMGIAQVTMNSATDRMQVYEEFLTKLNNTNDTKESLDLQARILAENGMMMNQLLQVMAAQLNQDATQSMQQRARDEQVRDLNR